MQVKVSPQWKIFGDKQVITKHSSWNGAIGLIKVEIDSTNKNGWLLLCLFEFFCGCCSKGHCWHDIFGKKILRSNHKSQQSLTLFLSITEKIFFIEITKYSHICVDIVRVKDSANWIIFLISSQNH